MIVFSYLSALVPNEIFIFKLRYINLLRIFILTIILNSQFFTSKIRIREFAFKFSQFQLLKIVTFMFIYFLIVIFIVIFITSFLKAPLKTKITYAIYSKNSPNYSNIKFLCNWSPRTIKYQSHMKLRIHIGSLFNHSDSNRSFFNYTFFFRH